MRNEKGFTLMEILAVLLVIAVIASFAVPLIKSVRRGMRYQQAKAAGVQLAEAVRSFYKDTKGCLPTSETTDGFYAPDAAEAGSCPTQHTIVTGVPGSCKTSLSSPELVLFACNYISPKMFVDLPYNFKIQDPRIEGNGGRLIIGKESGVDEEDERWFVINRDMTITEDDE